MGVGELRWGEVEVEVVGGKDGGGGVEVGEVEVEVGGGIGRGGVEV